MILTKVAAKIFRRIYFSISGVRSIIRCRLVKLQARFLWEGRFNCGSCRFNVPVRVTNSQGKIVIGNRVMLGYYAAPRLGNGEILLQARERDAEIRIGDDCAFSNNVSIIARSGVTIGNGFLCGSHVEIIDSDFHGISPDERRLSNGQSERISIGNNVWLGNRVIVLKGVEIGSGSVVAAGSVVTSALPPNVIAAGCPAKIIRQLI